MRARGSLLLVGIWGLVLLVPGVARAISPPNCTNGQPFQLSEDLGGATITLKVDCKETWVVFQDIVLSAGQVAVDVNAVEDGLTGRECDAKMVTTADGTEDFKTQKTGCTFTKDRKILFSFREQK